MKKEPLLILCICFIIGIIFQDFINIDKNSLYIILIISILSLFIFFIKSIIFVRLRSVFLGFFFAAAGILSHYLQNLPLPLPALQPSENVIFKVNKKLNSNEKNRRYEVVAYKDGSPFGAVLSVPKDQPALDFLHYYRSKVFASATKAPEYRYQFNYKKYLARKHIFYQLYARNQILSAKWQNIGFQDLIKQKRLEILNKIDTVGLTKNASEFLKGLILADRTEMDAQITQDFTRSGLVHFLAISGTHMVVIFWFIMLIFNRIFPIKFRKFAIVLALAFIWAFAIFIDYGSSVARSCIMLSVYYGSVLLQRKPDLLHSMAVAAFAILICDTNQIFDVGFQLSFVAVFGIYWLNRPILNLFPKSKSAFLRFIFGVISVTLAAQLITLPLVLYYFHQFSLISVVANLVIVPLSEVIIVFSLLMVVIIAIGLNFSLIDEIYNFVVFCLLKVIHFFADVDSVFFDRISMSFLEAAIVMVGVLFLRSVLIMKDLRSVARLSFAVIFFFAVRLLLNFEAYRGNEVLVHHLNKKSAVSAKVGNTVYFWADKDVDLQKLTKNIATPYIVQVRANKFLIARLPQGAKEVTIGRKQYALK